MQSKLLLYTEYFHVVMVMAEQLWCFLFSFWPVIGCPFSISFNRLIFGFAQYTVFKHGSKRKT